MTALGDGQRPRAGVARNRVPLHVAVFFQRAHQPGQRRGRDPLRGGQVAEAQRPGLLDRGQRGQLRGRQPGELVLAQPPGQARDRDPQPGDVDHGRAGQHGRGRLAAALAAILRTGTPAARVTPRHPYSVRAPSQKAAPVSGNRTARSSAILAHH